VKSNFEIIWKAYPNKPVARKADKQKCRVIFENMALETQRTIWQDIQARCKTLQWRDGFYPAPLVYFHQQPWLDPVEPAKVRDTTNEVDTNAQQIQGLTKLRDMLKQAGEDHSEIDKQIEELR